MVPLTTTHLVLATDLKNAGGSATAAELKTSYVKLAPLILNKFVSVSSKDGVPIYNLTPMGDEWLVMLGRKPTNKNRVVSRRRALKQTQ